ncbi:MAG: hypothetical protein V3V00_13625 [Saprospiraceae bacterium]
MVGKTYFDGFGKDILTLQYNQSPDSKAHIAFHSEYDILERVHKVYEAKSTNTSTYFNPSGDFTEHLYQKNMLARISSIKPPSWHATTFDYRTNNTTEATGYTTAGQLHITTVTDANGNKTLSYTDQKGNEVLMKKQNASSTLSHDTYTYWDQKDRKTLVLPPGTSLATPNLIYQYLYYANDLLKQKDAPDADPVEYVHNDRDLLAYMQDGNMDDDSRWMATKYDVYGNLTNEGWYNGNLAVNGSFAQAIVSDELMKINYNTSGSGTGQPNSEERNFLMTTEKYMTQYMYDPCGRPNEVSNSIFNNSLSFLTNSLIRSYDSRDAVTISRHDFKDGYNDFRRFYMFNDFDNAGRPKGESISHNFNGPYLKLSETTYTPKEQVKTKILGAQSKLAEIDYDYLPNGFLKSMSDPLFTQELYYDVPYDGNATTRKNGDISTQYWQVMGQEAELYHYGYDFKDQITSADYYVPNVPSNNGDYDGTYTFDTRGNILTINRQGGITTKSK